MAGLTIAASQTALDGLFPTAANGTYVGYSANGTTEFSGLARTAIGATGWDAATAADPSVKDNGSVLTSAAASGAGTVTHSAIFSAATAGSQLSDWQALGASKTLAIGDQLSFAVGVLQITLT